MPLRSIPDQMTTLKVNHVNHDNQINQQNNHVITRQTDGTNCDYKLSLIYYSLFKKKKHMHYML